MSSSSATVSAAAIAAARLLLGGEAVALSSAVGCRYAVSGIETAGAYSVPADFGGGLPVDDGVTTALDATRSVDLVDHRQDWKELAHVLDRLYFWLMLVMMTVSTSIIGLVPLYKNRF